MADDKRLFHTDFKYIEEYFTPRLVDVRTLREQFIHYVRSPKHFHWGDWPDMCIRGTEIDEVIANTPTVDTVPVVHGMWIELPSMAPEYKCSVCGQSYEWWEVSEAHYCPNCGAKMDRERKDNEKM